MSSEESNGRGCGPRHRHRHGRGRDTRRVQLEMPPQSMERLERLKDKTEATSYAEVMKTALRLYEALIEEAEAGREFAIRNADGTVTPYRIFV